MREDAPISVSAHGGRFAVDDDRTIPDTMEVIFELVSGALIIFGQYEASGDQFVVMCYEFVATTNYQLQTPCGTEVHSSS